MRLAVLSDVHSNLIALNLALDSLKKETVDKICFLGDYITDGVNDNEVLDIVKNVSDYAIFGNREKYILDYSPERKDFNNYKTIYTTYNNLTKDSLEYIKSLRQHYIVKVGRFSVLMIHGEKYCSDKNDIERVFDKIIDDFDFDICFFGHSHRHLFRKYRNKFFINPGSIGQSCDSPTYKYCIVEITDKVRVTLKEFEVEETFSELVRSYKKTNYYKDNRVWSNLVLYMIREGVDYPVLFLKELNERTQELDKLGDEEFNRLWDKTYENFKKKYNLDEL